MIIPELFLIASRHILTTSEYKIYILYSISAVPRGNLVEVETLLTNRVETDLVGSLVFRNQMQAVRVSIDKCDVTVPTTDRENGLNKLTPDSTLVSTGKD